MVFTIGRTKTTRRAETCRELLKKNRGQMWGGDNTAELHEFGVTIVTEYVIVLLDFAALSAEMS